MKHIFISKTAGNLYLDAIGKKMYQIPSGEGQPFLLNEDVAKKLDWMLVPERLGAFPEKNVIYCPSHDYSVQKLSAYLLRLILPDVKIVEVSRINGEIFHVKHTNTESSDRLKDEGIYVTSSRDESIEIDFWGIVYPKIQEKNAEIWASDFNIIAHYIRNQYTEVYALVNGKYEKLL